MVTVIDYAVRQSSIGEEFMALILQGSLEMVQSQETGRYYATAKRCSVSSTFTEESAKQLIGQQIPGKIIREACESFKYTIPETGDVITLSHRWVYTPDTATVAPTEEPVHQAAFSENGELVF